MGERTAAVQQLAEHGCSVLCLDSPEGILFGVDYAAFQVGPKFMGVKLIPPGLHFVYWSSSAEDVGAIRTGFFQYMRPRDVCVLRWDKVSEEFCWLENQEESNRFADGVRSFDFDGNLGPYPVDVCSQWEELTRFATVKLVNRIEPVSKKVRSKRAEYDGTAELPTRLQTSKHEMDEHQDAEEGVESMCVDECAQKTPETKIQEKLESNVGCLGTLFFTAVPRARKRVGETPEETTRLHMDLSPQLEELITRELGGDELAVLGELQIAYVAFLLGQNYDAFEHWKTLLMLICSCESAVVTRGSFFAEFLRTFYTHLSQAPADFFGDLGKDNFLGGCALSLLEICDGEAVAPRLRKRCEKLKELMQSKFAIGLEDLALFGEDAPQVVETGQTFVDLGPVWDGLD